MKPDFLEYNLAKSIFFLCFTCYLLLISSAPAEAHRVNLFAWVEGNTIHVECKFSGGRHVNAGKIIVLDSEGGQLLSGMTNENGDFSFKIPKKTDLKIILEAGEGHRAEWTIGAAEIEMPVSEERPALEEGLPAKNIVIGLGCIFALAAIVALVRKRKLKKTNHESTNI